MKIDELLNIYFRLASKEGNLLTEVVLEYTDIQLREIREVQNVK